MSKVDHDIEEATSIKTDTSEKLEHQVRASLKTDDWDGPDDPENPLNWTTWKKVYHVGVPALQCFTITFGSSVYTPGIEEVMHQFGVGQVVAILPLTVYVLGLAFGPMLSAPLSESFGRRAVYQSIFIPSLLFTLGAGLAQNMTTLIVCRFLAGSFGSGCLAVGAGTNSDVFAPMHRAAASSVFLLAPFLGPSLGPPAGGFASQAKGWRWTQWLILMIGLVTVLYSIPSQETYKKIILARRAKRLDLPPSQPTPPPQTGLTKLRTLILITMLRPMRMLATEPIIAFLSIYNAFNFSVLFGFFDAFPLVYQGIYKFDTGASGLAFLPIGIGCVLATALFILIDRLGYRRKTLRLRLQTSSPTTILPPEERLYAAILGSFLLPTGLFVFAWTARDDIHYLVPMAATILFGAGNLLIFCSAVLYLIDTYHAAAAASALAANGLLRYVCGAVFPLFTVQMYKSLGVGWATSLLGFVTVALLPIPWVLYLWGPRIRGRSGYAPQL